MGASRRAPVSSGVALRLLLATGNPGKQREFRELLADCGWELVVPADLSLDLDVEEIGTTYAENARIKAVAAAAAAGLPALADDSGLAVEALGGAPGVLSARYAGADATDADRRAKLLDEMRDVPDGRRGAAFECVIAIALPDGRGGADVRWCEGRCEGVIAREERGEGGFGYDPIFLLPQLGRTMAELPPDEKHAISHRGRSAREACRLLRELATGNG